MKLTSVLALSAATAALISFARAEVSILVLFAAGLAIIAVNDYGRRPLALRLAMPLPASRRRKTPAVQFRAPELDLDVTRFTA